MHVRGWLSDVAGWFLVRRLGRFGTDLMAIKRNAAGKIIAKKFSVKRLEEAAKCNTGFCLACGAEAGQVEPDARKYSCKSCGLALVYGAEEIAMRQFM
jgi:hypothetical protein